MDFMTTQGFFTKNKSVRNQRMFFAALSGFFMGTVVTLATSFIDTWFFPDLPLYLNWSSVLVAWVLWAFLGGLLASLSALSAEGWAGVFLSALGMAVTVLVINALQGSESMMVSLVAFFGLLLPFIAMMFPLAALFDWLAKRSVEALSLSGWPRSRASNNGSPRRQVSWLEPQPTHGPLPPTRSTVRCRTRPGGGLSIGGNLTPSPRNRGASACNNSGAPPSVMCAVPRSTA